MSLKLMVWYVSSQQASEVIKTKWPLATKVL